MSLFRKPKKPVVHRRVFSAADDDDTADNSDSENSYRNAGSGTADEPSKPSSDRMKTPPPPNISSKHEKKSKADKKSSSSKKAPSLLSFGVDEGKRNEITKNLENFLPENRLLSEYVIQNVNPFFIFYLFFLLHRRRWRSVSGEKVIAQQKGDENARQRATPQEKPRKR